MMASFDRLESDSVCAACGGRIPAGEPVAFVQHFSNPDIAPVIAHGADLRCIMGADRKLNPENYEKTQ